MQTVSKEFAAILKLEKRMKMKEANPYYYNMREELQKRLGAFVYNYAIGELPKLRLLKLCHMVYLYNACPLHNFLMKCGAELERITEPKTTTDANH